MSAVSQIVLQNTRDLRGMPELPELSQQIKLMDPEKSEFVTKEELDDRVRRNVNLGMSPDSFPRGFDFLSVDQLGLAYFTVVTLLETLEERKKPSPMLCPDHGNQLQKQHDGTLRCPVLGCTTVARRRKHKPQGLREKIITDFFTPQRERDLVQDIVRKGAEKHWQNAGQ